MVNSVGKAWWKRLLSDCASIKLFLTWGQLLMTVFKVLPDGLKSNLTFILNTHHVHTCSPRQTAWSVMKDLEVNSWNIPKSVAHLSSAPPSWLQSIFSTSSTDSSSNSLPSVSHWTSSSTNQLLCGCRKRHCDWSKVISRLTFPIRRFLKR